MLENMILRVGPINEDHQYKEDDIFVKMIDLHTKKVIEFRMDLNTNFEDLEKYIWDTYNYRFPFIEHEKIQIIDSNFTLENAIKYSDEKSRFDRLDSITLIIYVDEKPGFILSCRIWRRDFLSEDERADYWNEWENQRRNGSYRNTRSSTPNVRRANTSYQTPKPSSRYGNSSFTRAQTRTPLRSLTSRLH